MASLINASRPPAFCPGCAHERVVQALDRAFAQLGLDGQDVAIVSDIGCSGLFDTFFLTHALHGLHGRALTYAAGIKAVQPGLHVVATMGDGGIGIGGAHGDGRVYEQGAHVGNTSMTQVTIGLQFCRQEIQIHGVQLGIAIEVTVDT